VPGEWPVTANGKPATAARPFNWLLRENPLSAICRELTAGDANVTPAEDAQEVDELMFMNYSS
jgi:hypothetical protein